MYVSLRNTMKVDRILRHFHRLFALIEQLRGRRDKLAARQKDVAAVRFVVGKLKEHAALRAAGGIAEIHRDGQLIGHGCTVKSALNEMTMIAEGYFASECIRHINERHNISMPIADMVYDVLYRRANPRKRMRELSAQL